jgi:hypothetical protein
MTIKPEWQKAVKRIILTNEQGKDHHKNMRKISPDEYIRK